MTDRGNHDLPITDDVKQCDISRCTEWNHKFALQPVIKGNSAGERVSLKDAELASDGGQRSLRQGQVPVLKRCVYQEAFEAL